MLIAAAAAAAAVLAIRLSNSSRVMETGPAGGAVVIVVSIGGRAKPNLGDLEEPVEGGVPVWVMNVNNRKRVAGLKDGLALERLLTTGSSLGLQQRNWLGSFGCFKYR